MAAKPRPKGRKLQTAVPSRFGNFCRYAFKTLAWAVGSIAGFIGLVASIAYLWPNIDIRSQPPQLNPEDPLSIPFVVENVSPVWLYLDSAICEAQEIEFEGISLIGNRMTANYGASLLSPGQKSLVTCGMSVSQFGPITKGYMVLRVEYRFLIFGLTRSQAFEAFNSPEGTIWYPVEPRQRSRGR